MYNSYVQYVRVRVMVITILREITNEISSRLFLRTSVWEIYFSHELRFPLETFPQGRLASLSNQQHGN